MSKLMELKNKVLAGALFLVSAGALADGNNNNSNTVDYSQLTNAINFGNVMTGILAVAGALVGIYAGVAGVRWILRMVRGA
ncbi:major capsid protein [Xenorhabdus sp. SGI246]|uniref:major capsid protein n=1 Tax=Xenorhabdus sp. SGI246 TaxID=3158263 RepID=UPI00349F5CAA